MNPKRKAKALLLWVRGQVRTIERRACPETLRLGNRDFAGPDELSALWGTHSPGDRQIHLG